MNTSNAATAPFAVPIDLNGGPSAINGHHPAAVNTASTGALATGPPSNDSAVPPPPAPPLPPRLADDIAEMKALGKEGRWREAVAVLSRLKGDAAAATEGGDGGSDLAPNLAVYNAAISAVSRSAQWDEVRFI